MEAEQKKRPVLRYLRIAFSVACGILCLLLIFLWLRSYQWYDHCRGGITSARIFVIESFQGRFMTTLSAGPDPTWRWGSDPTNARLQEMVKEQEFRFGFGFSRQPQFRLTSLRLPHWFLVSIIAILGAIPWLRWRFSLRTLLIVTTIVASVLGIIAVSN